MLEGGAISKGMKTGGHYRCTQEVLPTAGKGVALVGTLRAVLGLCAEPPLTFRLRGHDVDSDPIKEIPS